MKISTKGPNRDGANLAAPAYAINYDLHLRSLEAQLAVAIKGRGALYHHANSMIEDLWQEGYSMIEALAKVVQYFEEEAKWTRQ